MLRLQKRLASSVLRCGKKKVWLDPNETNEIANANSRKYLGWPQNSNVLKWAIVIRYSYLNPQGSRFVSWWKMVWSSRSRLRFTLARDAARIRWHGGRVVTRALVCTKQQFYLIASYRNKKLKYLPNVPPAVFRACFDCCVSVQVRERVQQTRVCQKRWSGWVACVFCDVFWDVTESPRRLTGICKSSTYCIPKPKCSNLSPEMCGCIAGFLLWMLFETFQIWQNGTLCEITYYGWRPTNKFLNLSTFFPSGTTVCIWGQRVTCSRTNASWWSTYTSSKQTKPARSSWRKYLNYIIMADGGHMQFSLHNDNTFFCSISVHSALSYLFFFDEILHLVVNIDMYLFIDPYIFILLKVDRNKSLCPFII